MVYGGDDRIPALNAKVGHGDQFKVMCTAFQQNADRELLYISSVYVVSLAIWHAHKNSVIGCASLTVHRIHVFLQFILDPLQSFLLFEI